MRELTFGQRRKMKLEGILDSLISFKTDRESIYDVLKDLHTEGNSVSGSFEDLVQTQYGAPEAADDFEYLFCKVLTGYFLVKVLYVRDRERNGKVVTIFAEHAVALLKNTQAILREFVPEYLVDDFSSKAYLTYRPAGAEAIVDNLEYVPNRVATLVVQLFKVMSTTADAVVIINELESALKAAPRFLRHLSSVDRRLYLQARRLVRDTHVLVDRFLTVAKADRSFRNPSLITLRDIARTYALNVSLVYKLISLNESLAATSGAGSAARERARKSVTTN